jgi:DHA1 family inner membrane transport protein
MSSRRIFALLAFGNFVIGMGAFVVIGIVSPIADGLGISKASAGTIMTVYAFAYAIASPVAVAATGNWTRRTVLSLALALFLGGTLISAVSTSLTMLAFSRIIVAIGAALFTPVAAGVAVALADPQSRGKALATVFGGLTFAQVIGVPVGAFLAYQFGWAAAFWAVAALAVIGLLAIVKAVPSDIKVQASSVSAIVDTLRNPITAFAIGFTATFIAAIYIVFTFFGPLIEASVGTDSTTRSLYLFLFGIGAVAGNYAGGYLTDRIGSVKTLTILCIGQAALMPLFSVIPWGHLLFAILVGLWSSFGWSFMAPQQARLVGLAPQAQALVLALNAAMLYVGIALGSGLASAVLNWGGLEALGIAGGVGALLALAHLYASNAVAKRAVAAKAPAIVES